MPRRVTASTPSADTGGDPKATTSCERCKRRKSKCDRGLPACERCYQSQLSCVYLDRRRPGFSAGHRQILESRIQELEDENQRLRSTPPMNETLAATGQLQDLTLPWSNTGHTEQRQEDPSAQPLGGPQGPTPVSVSTHDDAIHDHDHDRTATAPATTSQGGNVGSDNRVATGHIHVHGHGHNHPLRQTDCVFQATYARTSSIVERVPPLDLVVASASIFFRHLHPWFPLLDTQRVMMEVARVREPSLLLYGIFGASLPFMYDSRLDQATSDSFWKYTKRRIFNETAEEPSYASLEACTLLTLDLSGMTNGPQAWSRLAVIARLAAQLRTLSGQALRPAVQSETSDQDMFIDKPGSRQHARLFWAIYALDSFITITTSQQPALNERTISPFLPQRDAVWTEQHGERQKQKQKQHTASRRPRPAPPATAATLFLYLLQLLDISRQIHTLFIEFIPFHGTTDDLSTWITSFEALAESPNIWLQRLPSHLQIVSDDEGENMHLHLNQHLIISYPTLAMIHVYGHGLTIHLNALVEFSNQTSLLPHQSNARRRCAQSVHRIVLISAMAVETVADQLGWPFSWAIWVSARYLFVGAAAAAASRASAPLPLPEEFYKLLAILQKMGQYWQISKKYWWLLRRAEDGYRQGQTTTTTSCIVKSMADLRIPTSDLEDQFRVDPVLSHRTGSGSEGASGDSSNVSSAEDAGGPSDLEMPQFDMVHQPVFAPADYLSDTWFTMPLSASSAYQQFPVDNTTRAADGWTFEGHPGQLG